MAAKLKVLDLFSGIGGFSLGLERTGGFETVAFCEIDPFCQKILAKHWPNVKCYNDVRTIDYDGAVDVITGGFPCQPFSTAGKRQGQDDDPHLWPAMFSLVKKYEPTWVIGENVAGLVSMGLDDVLTNLESEGYAARTFIIPACAVNAPHKRERVWIIAYAAGNGDCGKFREFCEKDGGQEERLFLSDKSVNFDVSHANGELLEGWERWSNRQIFEDSEFSTCEFFRDFKDNLPAPAVCRTNDGIPNRVDRLKSLGNSVVPQIPWMLGNAILEAEKQL